MKRTIFTALAVFQMMIGFSQVNSQKISLKAKVVDKNSKEILSFATVYNQRLSIGTATNLDGYFELPDNRVGDTIIISYIGYENKVIILSNKSPNVISLTPRSANLNEVTVVAKSDYLYNIMSNVRKKRRTKSKTSRTYFFLESLVDNQTIEIIENYYNGEYSNFGTNELFFKKGRIGLKEFKNRSFRSTESSRLFSMHNIFNKSDLFPGSPLAIKKKKLKRDFNLKLNRSYVENGSKIFVIDFTPKNGRTDLFGGTVWIDKDKNKLIKLKLKVENASVHPFVPIGYNTLERLDMEITKTYKTINGEQFINTMDFNYDVHYVDTLGSRMNVTTKAFTKAYNYEKEFELPYFEFSELNHQDYRNLTVAPYDTTFWKRTSEFRFYDRLQEVENFILENKIENYVIHARTRKDSARYQLQFPYISWHPARFEMRQAQPDLIEKAAKSKPFIIDRINFGCSIVFRYQYGS